MPRGDGTGPMGQGRMTGRGMGYCAGFDSPGYMNAGWGGGRMRGRGPGFGRGLRRAWGASMPIYSSDEDLSFDKRVSDLEAKIDELSGILKEMKESK